MGLFGRKVAFECTLFLNVAGSAAGAGRGDVVVAGFEDVVEAGRNKFEDCVEGGLGVVPLELRLLGGELVVEIAAELRY